MFYTLSSSIILFTKFIQLLSSLLLTAHCYLLPAFTSFLLSSLLTFSRSLVQSPWLAKSFLVLISPPDAQLGLPTNVLGSSHKPPPLPASGTGRLCKPPPPPLLLPLPASGTGRLCKPQARKRRQLEELKVSSFAPVTSQFVNIITDRRVNKPTFFCHSHASLTSNNNIMPSPAFWLLFSSLPLISRWLLSLAPATSSCFFLYAIFLIFSASHLPSLFTDSFHRDPADRRDSTGASNAAAAQERSAQGGDSIDKDSKSKILTESARVINH